MMSVYAKRVYLSLKIKIVHPSFTFIRLAWQVHHTTQVSVCQVQMDKFSFVSFQFRFLLYNFVVNIIGVISDIIFMRQRNGVPFARKAETMNTQTIDGKCYARMLLGGAARLAERRDELNALNVFPVADGDTGTNMLKTVEGGLSRVSGEMVDVGAASCDFSKGILLSARGNSGVILSQIFAGINEGLAGLESVTASQLAEAYKHGISRSYAAVQNPTEGTILTVFRESTEYAAAHIDADSSVEDFYRLHVEEAKRSLAATPKILPVLAEAGVVDSGAAGYLCIAEGMYEALGGAEISFSLTEESEKSDVDIDKFTRDSVLEFGYCTEFLLRLTTAKVDPDNFDISRVLSVLDELAGESVVAYKQDDIVKVHVHTFTPGAILARMQEFGEFLTVKIENMSLGHSEEKSADIAQKPKADKTYAVVCVASGDGMAALFKDMGADLIVSGGQTSNPSIEEFVRAVDECGAENIIVLPNNKNIILAAKQAAELYEGARVHVIPSKSIMQGYGALSVITPGIKDMDALVASATRAAVDTVDGEITQAVRDAVIDGVQVKVGDYMAISGGEIAAVADNPEDAVLAMLEKTDTELCEIITLIVGKSVSDDKRAELTERLSELYGDCEVVVHIGGQDVYDYYVAVE